MQIQSIQNTKFTGYSVKDAKLLQKHVLKYKQGSLSDLYKKFDFNLVDSFQKTNRIDVPAHTQNWKLGENVEKGFANVQTRNNLRGGMFSKVRR